MSSYTVELTRPNKSVTWGFSIQGGKDFGCPLSVLRVTPNSISDRMAMRVQDLILKINGIPTDTLTHQQSILQIQNLIVKLELTRSIHSESGQLGSKQPEIEMTNFNNSCRISTSITDLPPPPPELCNFNKPHETFHDSYYPPPPPPPPEIGYFNKTNPPNDKFYAPPPFSKNDSPSTTKSYDSPHKFNQPVTGSPNLTRKIEKSPEVSYSGNGKPKEQPALGLGHFLQNQNQNRDNRDLIIQRPNIESNVAICFVCKDHIKGAYIEANNKVYCSNHFCCSYCNKPIKGTQFIETKEGTLYCMDDFINNVAPRCARCSEPIVEHQIMALGKCWHPQCFVCHHCKKSIPQGQFHIKEENNDVLVYCEKDFKDHYELKCFGCKLAIDSDDKYLMAGNNNYHVECFKR